MRDPSAAEIHIYTRTEAEIAALADVPPIQFAPDVERVAIADGIELPEEFSYSPPPRDGELRGTVYMRVIDGHAVCVAVTLEPWTAPTGEHTRISRRTAKEFPLGRLLRDAPYEAARVTRRQPEPENPDAAYWERQRRIEKVLAEQRGEPDPVRAVTRPSRGLREAIPMDDRELERVAEIYKAAAELGRSTYAAIDAEYHVSRTTASRWVRRARDRGLIPEARKDA
jgi:hypothetical protein